MTEPVVPLEVYLKEDGAKSDMAISWGIHQIAVSIAVTIIVIKRLLEQHKKVQKVT